MFLHAGSRFELTSNQLKKPLQTLALNELAAFREKIRFDRSQSLSRRVTVEGKRNADGVENYKPEVEP